MVYLLSNGQAVTANVASTNAPRNPGLDELDIFVTVASGGAWAGITALSAILQASIDGENWITVKDSSGADVSLDFTADGSAYVTVTEVPGFYFRLYYDVTGTGDTVTVTATGVGRL